MGASSGATPSPPSATSAGPVSGASWSIGGGAVALLLSSSLTRFRLGRGYVQGARSRTHRLSGRPVADTVASVFQVAGLCGGGGLGVSGSAHARMTVRSLRCFLGFFVPALPAGVLTLLASLACLFAVALVLLTRSARRTCVMMASVHADVAF